MNRKLPFPWLTALVLSVSLLLFTVYACDGGGSGCNPGDADYDTNSAGPYATTQSLNSGPSGESGLFYPSGAGPFPIFLWGCGGSLKPNYHADDLDHIASWGFVVVAEVSSGTGKELVEALDWLTSQNSTATSVLYQKLDLSKVAAGGHSLGSITTFQMADDPRLSTTIHVAGGSFLNGGGTANLRNPAAFFCGSDDGFGATDNAAVDFEVADVPVFFGIMSDTTHMQAPTTSRSAMAAWLLWHLKGETDRSGDFLNSDGEFQTGIWESQIKNW